MKHVLRSFLSSISIAVILSGYIPSKEASIAFGSAFGTSGRTPTFVGGDYFRVRNDLLVLVGNSFESRFNKAILNDWVTQSLSISDVDAYSAPGTGFCDGRNTDYICALQVPGFTKSIDEQHGGTPGRGILNQEELNYIVREIRISTWYYKDIP